MLPGDGTSATVSTGFPHRVRSYNQLNVRNGGQHYFFFFFKRIHKKTRKKNTVRQGTRVKFVSVSPNSDISVHRQTTSSLFVCIRSNVPHFHFAIRCGRNTRFLR